MSVDAKRASALASLMAIWWITEAIPIPVTALLPIVLCPFLQIMTAKEIALPYADRNIFLFMGGFFIAMAMQRWNLHKRIALHIIRIIGTSPRRIVLGFMLATAFLSMWISNTATTMMMLPIAMAVIMQAVTMLEKEQGKKIDPKNLNFSKALMFGIAYASSIGGIGTLVGTPPNIVFAGMVKSIFPEAPEINFFRWMMVGLPIVIIFLPIVWFYLVRIATPIRFKRLPVEKDIIREQIQELGAMSNPERWTLIVFLLTALGWIFRRT